MFGCIAWAEEDAPPPPAFETCTVLGVRFFCVNLRRRRWEPDFLLRRRLRRAARRLRHAGVARAVFPPDFPFGDIFARRGIAPVPVLPLRRALTEKLALCLLSQRGLAGERLTLGVWGDRLPPEGERAVAALCRTFRHVTFGAACTAPALACALRRDYGVAVRRSTAELAAAALVLAFAPLPAVAPPCALPLYPGSEETCQVTYLLPPETETLAARTGAPEGILAALFAAGGLEIDAISPRCITFRT